MPKYIYQYESWPKFTWDDSLIYPIFGEVRSLQGKIQGLMESIGFSAKEEATLSTLTKDVIKSSEIEGEALNYEQVRSSIARRLGINITEQAKANRHVEGVVEMMLDATQNHSIQLTPERLFSWHSALFPTGYSGMHKIEVAQYRSGAMQVVSGPMGKETVHYQAIEASKLQHEMDEFLKWFNAQNNQDPLLKAAIAHLWFIIIHPFDDGNGRIARAITDLQLNRSEKTAERFYSMSNQILVERKQYYKVLQEVQHSSGDITVWMLWFFNCLKSALLETEKTLESILEKARFWVKNEDVAINERQRLMLNKLLDGFDGKLKSSKWAKITKCSIDTALRDIKDLIRKGILVQEKSGGRSTNYQLSHQAKQE